MKKLSKAIECLVFFCSDVSQLVDIASVKKLYKKAALVAHSDRAKENACPYSMAEINAAWETVSAANWSELASLLGIAVKPVAIESCWTDDPLHKATVPAFYTVETLSKMAWRFESGKSSKDANFSWFRSGRTYFSDLKWELNYWPGSECFALTDLQNALAFRKECISYRILLSGKTSKGDVCRAFCDLVNANCRDNSPEAVIEWLGTLEMKDLGRYKGFGASFDLDDVEVRIYREVQASHEVFTPFDLGRLKPLTEYPKKFTIAHLRRAIANGQFYGLKQDYYLTDDYAHDAACNYRKGYIANPLEMLSKLIGDDLSRLYQSGSDSGKVVLNFGYHSNDGRSITIDLNCRYPLVDMADEEGSYLQGPIQVKELVAA
jgi:hypothetical protein